MVLFILASVAAPFEKPGSLLPTLRLGVIDDARRRQRRRRLGLLAALMAGLLAAVLVLEGSPRAPVAPLQRPPAAAPQPPAEVVGWRVVLSREPYMGVSCGTPNSTACDRLGLAVWLKSPALRVSATLLGRRFALADRAWSGPARRAGRRMFAGFLAHAGLSSKLRLP